MLTIDVDQRYSADDVLAHPWMAVSVVSMATMILKQPFGQLSIKVFLQISLKFVNT